MNWMTRRGWMRLYVVVVILWTLLTVAFGFLNYPDERLFAARASGDAIAIAAAESMRSDWLKSMAVIWILPSVALYIGGRGLAWVIKGFVSE